MLVTELFISEAWREVTIPTLNIPNQKASGRDSGRCLLQVLRPQPQPPRLPRGSWFSWACAWDLSRTLPGAWVETSWPADAWLDSNRSHLTPRESCVWLRKSCCCVAWVKSLSGETETEEVTYIGVMTIYAWTKLLS